MVDERVVEEIRGRWLLIGPELDERRRRLWAATEARQLGQHGAVTAVHRATGLSRPRIYRGLRELEAGEGLEAGRVRRDGAGRPTAERSAPGLVDELEALVDPVTRGDPESALRWTAKSCPRLARELADRGFSVTANTVRKLLRAAGYSLQSNAKVREGRQHPDRNAQFEHINSACARFARARQPAISIDTKKKELVGDFKNAGREWRPVGQPEHVRTHDFKDPELGKAIPYGVYDIDADEAWVSVGVDHDTSAFAVETIRRWWHNMGSERYPDATRLLVTADCGGSNGNRTRLWKVELQRLADDTGLAISVCHFPPGTSKWNKIEHRLFSFITKNWRGTPLESLLVVVNLIAATRTQTGLTVQCELDPGIYPDKIKVTDAQLANTNITTDKWHGEWNYTIHPHPPT
jgi:hypothetical protein